MILLVDNYDSFSYNLVQLIGSITKEEIRVIRNDEMKADEIISLNPTHIILSPGPKRPEQAGVCVELIKKVKGSIPTLGVCLGHQSICMVYGAEITYAGRLMHGKQSNIQIENQSRLFLGMPEKILAARYHSLMAAKDTIPSELNITAVTEDGEVMAVEHKEYPVFGVQFHPESILTPLGRDIMDNFLKVNAEKN